VERIYCQITLEFETEEERLLFQEVYMQHENRRLIGIILFGILLILGNSSLFGQGGTVQTGPNRAAQYYLGYEDELLIPVNIWGFVQKPGQYMVPDNTELIALLSYAGGPTNDAKISNIRIIRNDPTQGNIVYVINVKKFIDTGDERLIPSLKPGDTIIVKGTTFHWITRFFSFISQLAVLVNIYYLISLSQWYADREK